MAKAAADGVTHFNLGVDHPYSVESNVEALLAAGGRDRRTAPLPLADGA